MADTPVTAPASTKRDAIFQAALELFAERGFHGTAVPQIAERAGVGAGTIYRYFESKEALVNDLYRHWKAQLAATISEELPEGLTVREQFRHVWRRLMTFALANSTALEFLELHHHGHYLDDESRQEETENHNRAVALMSLMRDLGFLKPIAPEIHLSLIWGSFVSMVRFHRLGLLEVTEERIDQIEQCIWEAIRS